MVGIQDIGWVLDADDLELKCKINTDGKKGGTQGPAEREQNLAYDKTRVRRQKATFERCVGYRSKKKMFLDLTLQQQKNQ